MAETFIEEIYRDAIILYQMKRAVSIGHKGMAAVAFEWWSMGGAKLQERLPQIREQDAEMADRLWRAALHCREVHLDLPLFTARLEEEMIPLFLQYLKSATGIDVSEGRWNLQSSRSSFLTLKDLDRGMYLHSSFDPMWEAYELIQEIYDPLKHVYHILGCGLGYVPYVLWEESDRSAEIYLYENDADILEYAGRYGVLDWIDKNQLHVIHEEDPNDLLEKFLISRVEHSDEGSLIMPWKREELHTVYDQELSDEYNNDLGRRMYNRLWDINLTNNLLKPGIRSMDELKPGDYKKEWVVVAAGPSLDDNMEYLRESQGKRTIVAVNTIFRKLLKEGIRPDLLTVIDPTVEVATHLDGVEERTKDIPLLAEQLTNWHFLARYQGPVYLIVSKNSLMRVPLSKQKEIDPWSVNGTVSSLAITAAIRLGAEKVQLVGLDLAYPENKRYADGSPHETSIETYGIKEIDSVDGGKVNTNETFNFFRTSIEQDIQACPQVRFYNRSKHGAYIHGTMMNQWWEKTDAIETPEDKKRYLNRMTGEAFLTWRRQYYLFRQLLSGMDEDERQVLHADLEEVYAGIFAAFKEELDWNPSPSGADSGLTYVFSVHYERRKEDPFSEELRKKAL
ncbi:MAG: DUF115 domain-containing protein [Lachnospiraceae bacterium]|nr:DUF115 domain-containing protein [Lachnospiraceae bacterium]